MKSLLKNRINCVIKRHYRNSHREIDWNDRASPTPSSVNHRKAFRIEFSESLFFFLLLRFCHPSERRSQYLKWDRFAFIFCFINISQEQEKKTTLRRCVAPSSARGGFKKKPLSRAHTNKIYCTRFFFSFIKFPKKRTLHRLLLLGLVSHSIVFVVLKRYKLVLYNKIKIIIEKPVMQISPAEHRSRARGWF